MSLHNDPFQYERYERDSKWITTAIGVLLTLAVCSLILYVTILLSI